MMIHTKIDQQMDPRLQYAIARRHFGIAEAATVWSEPNEIAVIAKVTNLKCQTPCVARVYTNRRRDS